MDLDMQGLFLEGFLSGLVAFWNMFWATPAIWMPVVGVLALAALLGALRPRGRRRRYR